LLEALNYDLFLSNYGGASPRSNVTRKTFVSTEATAAVHHRPAHRVLLPDDPPGHDLVLLREPGGSLRRDAPCST
jgi:hypothetical protein